MPRPLRVFLCHASQDKPIVRELYQRLKAENWIDPWLDKAKLLPGQDWELVIEKAVDDSDVVIVCLSSQSVTKEGFVQREIRYAYDLALEKPEDTIFLIPLRLDDCVMPRKLRSFHWVDYFGKEKKNSYSDLLQALKLRYDQKLKMEEAQTQEEPKVEAPEKQPENYTKILDPSTLNPTPIRKTRSQPDYLRYGILGILLLLFILGGFVLNSLFNKPPEATSTPASQIFTETPKPLTEISATSTATLTHTPTPSPMPTLVIGSTMISEKDDMVMVYVPEGEFIMGSDSDLFPDEQPVHRVLLSAYWIDRTEVTIGMYARCVSAGQCNPSENDADFTNYPVTFISWYNANDYCKYAGKRLPTEAEWEKAARGKNGYTYPWGNIDPQDYLLSSSINGQYGHSTEVGSYPAGASVYGALDMAGSVSEWVSSIYEPYPYDATDGREGITSFDDRVVRGSSWISVNREIHSAFRDKGDPTLSNFIIGFRCALSQP